MSYPLAVADTCCNVLSLIALQAADAYKDTDADIEATPPLDRTAAMEDCARFALEADESQVIAKIVGEALKLLNVTTRNGGTASSKGERIVSCTGLLSDEIAIVSAEVASAVTEAEGLVDGLLRVIEVIAWTISAVLRLFFWNFNSVLNHVIGS